MTRKQLQQLSKPQLIEIILQLQALIEQLQVRVAELEEQNKRLTEPPKDCTNSSIPPSPSPQPNRAGTKTASVAPNAAIRATAASARSRT